MRMSSQPHPCAPPRQAHTEGLAVAVTRVSPGPLRAAAQRQAEMASRSKRGSRDLIFCGCACSSFEPPSFLATHPYARPGEPSDVVRFTLSIVDNHLRSHSEKEVV